MGTNYADYAAIAPWTGIQGKPTSFPTSPSEIAQDGATNGQALIWNEVEKSWAPGSGGISSVAWGDITGNIGDQLDLSNALATKAEGAASSTTGNFAGFADTTGKVLEDTGKSAASFDTAGAAATAQANAETYAAAQAAAAQAAAEAYAAALLTGGFVPTGGANFARLAKNSATNFDTGWYGPDTFNVKDYGAKGDGTSDDVTAITNAINAGIATNLPFCLYFPMGTYKCSTALSITLATTGQAICVKGDGPGVSQLYFSNTSTNGGITVSRSAGGGTYLTDAPFTCHDLGFISNSAAGYPALVLTMTGTDAQNQGSLIFRCTFYQATNGGSTYFSYGIDILDWSQVNVSECTFNVLTAGIRVRGTNGATSGFGFSKNWHQGGTYGVKVDGTGTLANRIEGVWITDCSFIDHSYAVWYENTNAGGVLVIKGGQMVPGTSGVGACIHAKQIYQVSISGIAIANDGAGTGAWNGIELGPGCNNAIVNGCQIIGANGGGLTIQGVSISFSSWCVVSGNSFGGFTGTNNVVFDANVTKSNCSNNVSNGGSYTDSGTGDNFNNNI